MAFTKRLFSATEAVPVAPSVVRVANLKIIANIVVLLSFLLASIAAPLHAAEADAVGASNIGQPLYESRCVVCHKPMKAGQKHGSGHGVGKDGGHGDSHGAEKGHQNRLAPPMMMVKKHYLKVYPERDAFVEKVADWIAAPDQNAAMLGHAVDRFGLMPPQAIDELSRKQIAEYIFDDLPVSRGKHGGSKHDGDSNCHRDKEKGPGDGTQNHGGGV